MVRTHTVVAGETLSALALRFYGDAELYRLIATASGIADPNVINVGQRLIMPDFTRYTVVAETRCQLWRCASMVTRN